MMRRKNETRRSRRRAGITLIEMLVVITIIALFSAVAYQRFQPVLDDGRITAARTQIESLKAALQVYNIKNGNYPSEDEGLDAVQPYMDKDIPLDPWNNPYVYRFPGENGEPELLSYGADGEPGGEGVNADILSWK